jgi:hypothetical protein
MDNINITFSIGDIRNLSFGNNNKTYTFPIPLTKNNRKLLSFITEPDVKTEPDTLTRLYIKEQLIIQGRLKVIGFNENNATVLVSSDDWISELEGRKMTSLDLSTYNHLLTHTNVESSWTGLYEVFRYPMINFGYVQTGSFISNRVWLPTDFVPMIQVTTLIEKILSKYTIVSDFLTSAFAKNLYIIGRETLAPDSFTVGKELEVKVALNSDDRDTYTIAGGATVTRTLTKDPLILTDEITDEGGDFAASEYVVPETGTYRFQVKFALTCDADPVVTINSQTVTLRIYQNTDIMAEYTASGTSNIIDVIDLTLDTYYIHCVAGDVIKGYMYLESNMTNTSGGNQTVDMGMTAGTSWMVALWGNANRYPGLNKNISLEEMLPDISQVDFLSMVRDLFNLRFWIDKSKGTLYIEPWDQFLSSTVIDLTDQVDYLSLSTDLISKEYNKTLRFKFKDDGSDGAYMDYLKSHTSPGEKIVTLNSIYCKPEEGPRESQFSSIVTDVSGYEIDLPTIRNVSYQDEITFNRASNFNTRLVQWDGLTTVFSWFYETETKTSYPKISGLVFDDIYSDYLLKFYHYIDKGKLLTCKIKIKPEMLGQFFSVINSAEDEAFRCTYQIQDNYYFLQRITTDGEQAELELILKV